MILGKPWQVVFTVTNKLNLLYVLSRRMLFKFTSVAMVLGSGRFPSRHFPYPPAQTGQF